MTLIAMSPLIMAAHPLKPHFIMNPRLISIIIASCCFFSPAVAEEAAAFKDGQQISWLDRITGKWEAGTYKWATPGNKQPIIWKRPGDPNSQTAYTWEDIKSASRSDTSKSAGTASKLPPLPLPPTPQPGATPGTNPAMGKLGAMPQAAGGPPLTEDQILKFITDRVGNTPFADSAKLQKTKDELGALIKQRGTAFLHDSAISDFGQKISALGMTSEVTGPLSHNYGPPNKQDWLWGSWVTSKVGLPVKYVEGNKLMLWTEIGAANTGKVTINPDGTYVWNTDSAQGVIQGKWHEASIAEMADQGGAGVVLENAKNGVPWVAFKYRAGNPREEWLGLAEVNHRSIREGAMRIPTK